MARTQNAGRGRNGKKWDSTKPGFYYSLKIKLPEHKARGWLPVMTGIACHRALVKLGYSQFRLKWPNDILSTDHKKLAGILLESFKDELIVGIGINTERVSDDFAFLPNSPSSIWLAKAIGNELNKALAEDSVHQLSYWEAHTLYPTGSLIKATQAGGIQVAGTIHKLSLTGELWIQNSLGELISLQSAEVSGVTHVQE